MQSYTAALFTSGPVAHLIDLAIRVQTSQGELSLDDEIRRYIRVTGASDTAKWSCPARTGAAMLDVAGELLTENSPVAIPDEFRQKLAQASGDEDAAEYLHTLAGIVRILDRDLPPDYSELPMNTWEAGMGFPHLSGFTAHLTDDVEATSLADSVNSYIAGEHPFCTEVLPRTAAEAHRALVLFPDADSLRTNLLRPIPWISADALRELLRTVDDHMLREHS
ncbi:hypothetical protein [Streptomyces sp. CBMA152]|uniref:hypothetical protein n=1 Tax=Streptomyces sp. CBMA152 TaxID=1896312 RepID=UPI00166055CF|nr:hypothetical protein [Streptomyces sp. CBMA152]MBD0745552.1 hypothetical protein [Streptomyces sp. CBMA152]